MGPIGVRSLFMGRGVEGGRIPNWRPRSTAKPQRGLPGKNPAAHCRMRDMYNLIAKLILKLLPVQGPYNLTLDRTNWKFSDSNINILTLGIIYDGITFPIVFKMMDKRDNSNIQERNELVNRFIRLAFELHQPREFEGSE